jgi:hypothetical protein
MIFATYCIATIGFTQEIQRAAVWKQRKDDLSAEAMSVLFVSPRPTFRFLLWTGVAVGIARRGRGAK